MQQLQAEELLKKYHSGKCSPEEIALLESWYLKHEMEVPELSEFEKANQLDEIWMNLPVHSKKKYSTLWQGIAASAAMLLLAISAGLSFYHFEPKPSPHHPPIAQEITPGEQKAVLTLADGKKISLSALENRDLAEQSGVKISKTAEGQLIYTVKDTPITTEDSEVLEYNTIETPIGGQYQVNLPDGTKVWLNAASTFRFPVQFTGKERIVELTGEGYFEVAASKSKTFKVLSAGQTVEVLGTHFNVMAYPNEKITKTTLIEGSVKVSNSKGSKLLTPGQQAEGRLGSPITLNEKADLEDAIAWKNGYFKFDGNLESIMNKISRWYNVEIIYEFKPDVDMEFAGKISRNRDIKAVLRIMEFTGKVHFKVDGRRVIVTK